MSLNSLKLSTIFLTVLVLCSIHMNRQSNAIYNSSGNIGVTYSSANLAGSALKTSFSLNF